MHVLPRSYGGGGGGGGYPGEADYRSRDSHGSQDYMMGYGSRDAFCADADRRDYGPPPAAVPYRSLAHGMDPAPRFSAPPAAPSEGLHPAAAPGPNGANPNYFHLGARAPRPPHRHHVDRGYGGEGRDAFAGSHDRLGTDEAQLRACFHPCGTSPAPMLGDMGNSSLHGAPYRCNADGTPATVCLAGACALAIPTACWSLLPERALALLRSAVLVTREAFV